MGLAPISSGNLPSPGNLPHKPKGNWRRDPIVKNQRADEGFLEFRIKTRKISRRRRKNA